MLEHKKDASFKPLLRGHFHQAMFFIALGACVPLVLRATGSQFWSVLVYSICALTMFGISTIYHRVTWTADQRFFWKKLDHCGIYLMIAGTFTPVAVMGLEQHLATKLLITIWSVTVVGIIQSIFFVNLPKIVSSLLYLIAGYLIIPYTSELLQSIGTANSVLILVGGLVYTVGALCYGFKWPKLKPSHFGYHELFHILINIAATLHFIVINSLVH